jgi:hypothetical protein
VHAVKVKRFGKHFLMGGAAFWKYSSGQREMQFGISTA